MTLLEIEKTLDGLVDEMWKKFHSANKMAEAARQCNGPDAAAAEGWSTKDAQSFLKSVEYMVKASHFLRGRKEA